MAETDGFEQRVLRVKRPLCIARSELHLLAKLAGLGPGEILEFKITHDPDGSPSSLRRRFYYENDSPNPPAPPREMSFGELEWWPQKQDASLAPRWFTDARSYLRDLMLPYASSQPQIETGAKGDPAAEWTETIGEVKLTFVSRGSSRRLVEYWLPVGGRESSCTEAYLSQERVTSVSYAYGDVIESFETFSETEGRQDYMLDEAELPRVWQGSVKDVVSTDRMIDVTKQRCGQGQVQTLVAVQSLALHS